ncbi:MAG: hypothetical protein GY859_09275 [Desulfobacterales bacterium]|nr:hypothetical protein [Desulfobacterales bacterium]
MRHILSLRAQVRIDGMRRDDMVSDLLEGEIDPLIQLTETMLNGLSNRDYMRFDEKYIKVVMLSLLSDVNLYIPYSEYETGADGHVDLYLQAAFDPERSVHYFIELKYAKAAAGEEALDRKEREGRAAMARYLKGPAARGVPRLHAYVLVFRKDRCARRIRCEDAPG